MMRFSGRRLLTLFVSLLALSTLAHAQSAGQQPGGSLAKNVILFIGDAGGIPILNAASLYRYNKPQQLFMQKLPYIGLMDTSASDAWVTDSAAGMTAIVTGEKTGNGVISQASDAVRGKQDGRILKTILEYAEERGLSTAVVSNMAMVDATPAACYAHANDRAQAGEIFSQLLAPRFGDGVDLVIGPGLRRIAEAMKERGLDWAAAATEKGYQVTTSPESIPPDAKRLIALFDSNQFDLPAMTQHAIDILSQNPKGYFLMVECDMHTDNIKAGLDHVLTMDEIIRATAGRVSSDTLIVFTADHSFDLRLRGGKPGNPLLPSMEETHAADNLTPPPPLRMDEGHTGEEVLVAGKGPGAERIHGYILNTDLFKIMMAAYGWE